MECLGDNRLLRWDMVEMVDSTYVAVMGALCGGVNIMDDGVLSRTKTISGGGGCKAFANLDDGRSCIDASALNGRLANLCDGPAAEMRRNVRRYGAHEKRLSVGAHTYTTTWTATSRLVKGRCGHVLVGVWGRPWGCPPLCKHTLKCV